MCVNPNDNYNFLRVRRLFCIIKRKKLSIVTLIDRIYDVIMLLNMCQNNVIVKRTKTVMIHEY